MRLIIYPSKMSSSGAKALKVALNTIMVYPDRHYAPRRDDVVINWGNGIQPGWHAQILNTPLSVRMAIKKTACFVNLRYEHVPSVLWTVDPDDTNQWLAHGNIVFARQILHGTQGQGIVVMHKPEDFVDAPLYTLYEPGCKEYRIHVAFGKVINEQQKKKKRGVEVDRYIRSHNNGWIFARNDIAVPECVKATSIKAVAALGLDFGAVDILYNPKTGKEFVLEVNTAPGLDSDNSINCYAEAFKQYAKELHV